MSLEVIDIEGLKRLSGNDLAFVSEILILYRERTAKDVAELREACANDDWNTIRFVVHRMRSAAVPLGLKNLVVALKKIELGIKENEIDDLHAQLNEVFEITEGAMDDAREKLEIVSA